jgi:hypothetical protein
MPTNLQDQEPDHKGVGHAEGNVATSYGTDAFQNVDTEYNPNPSAKRKSVVRDGHGYEVPEDQFRYEDEDRDGDLGDRGRI